MSHFTAKQKLIIVFDIRKSKYKRRAVARNNINICTYHRWEQKLKEYGSDSYLALENGNRKPKRSPKTFNDETVIKRIIELRKTFGYGRKMIFHILLSEGIKCGESAIEGTLKRAGLWKDRKKKIRKKHKGKHVIKFKKPGKKLQIDLKYAYFGDILYYQFTAVDMATRLVFTKLYFEKMPENAEDFVKRCVKYFPFKIKSIQTDNGTEFTYRCHNFQTEHPLDKLCGEEKIERVFSPVASPWFTPKAHRAMVL